MHASIGFGRWTLARNSMYVDGESGEAMEVLAISHFGASPLLFSAHGAHIMRKWHKNRINGELIAAPRERGQREHSGVDRMDVGLGRMSKRTTLGSEGGRVKTR